MKGFSFMVFGGHNKDFNGGFGICYSDKKMYLMLHGIKVKSTIIINESLYNLSMLLLVDKFV